MTNVPPFDDVAIVVMVSGLDCPVSGNVASYDPGAMPASRPTAGVRPPDMGLAAAEAAPPPITPAATAAIPASATNERER
jgi:hypothetical protein